MSLGLEVAIEKTEESDETVGYRFFVRKGRGGVVAPESTGRPGLLRLSKNTGDVALEEPCPDDIELTLFYRARAVVRRHWKEGSFPSSTSWTG